MRWIVCYDIPSDRARTKIADFCLDKGLTRMQYSVFVGAMSKTHALELAAQARRRLGRQPGQIRFIPVCSRDWSESFKIQVGPHLECDGED